MTRFNSIQSIDDLLGYLDLFCQIAAQIKADPTTPLSEIAGKSNQEVSASTISNCIARLEGHYSERLIERKPKSPKKQITPFGESLYEQSRKVIQGISLLQGPSKNLRQVNVVCSNFLLGALMPQVVSAYYDARGDSRAKLTFHDVYDPADVVKHLANFRLDLAVRWSSSAPYAQTDKTETIPLGEPFDVVLVMHPSHRLAKDFVNERSKPVEWAELATERVYHISPELQVLMSELPPATDNGERVEVDYYDTVLRFVRTGIEGAVGIVPGLYDKLDHFRRIGELFYAQIQGNPQVGLTVTTRRGGIKSLTPEARQFYETFVQNLDGIPRDPGWPIGSQPEKVTLREINLRRLTEVYYVSCHNTDRTPNWYHGRIKWKQWRGNQFTAIMSDNESAGTSRRIYDVVGEILAPGPHHPLLHFTATWAGPPADISVAIFNSTTENGAICVGTWSGRDDLGWPTSAPMVLSERELKVDDLHRVSRQVTSRVLLQARKLAD